MTSERINNVMGIILGIGLVADVTLMPGISDVFWAFVSMAVN